MMASSEHRASCVDQRVLDARRLEVVRNAGLLDSPREEIFDSLSRLAVTLLGVPASFLSIVDARRDFYKAQTGFGEPLATTRELQGRTFCHYTLASTEPLVIEDTHADPVWRAVPTVDSLGVRAYVGVPIVINGQNIGSFCVIDAKPRQWTPVEIEIIVHLARSAASEIRLRDSLTQAVAEAERAHALARENEALLAVVAHDLRSPLQVMGLNTALLNRLTDETARPHVKRIDGAIASMRRLVDDLLATHATSGAKRALSSPIACGKLLGDALDTMAVVTERAGIELEVVQDSDEFLLVDYAQMLRVLCNLIGNCVKYCPAGTRVSLQGVDVADGTEIRVHDDGPGMSPEDRARAFERGWQGEAGLAGRDGAGLGLSIVQNLVVQNGGRVSLESQLGVGTKVTIWLPHA